MKSAVANTIFGTPLNWMRRVAEQMLISLGTSYPTRILRVALVPSILYFGVAALAIGMAILLVLTDAVRCVWFF
ncbi:hypothetical protein [Paraburkholderia dipogonis]|uniref:hypothetical protein n=1 Tax=Paraburkholderia dipogonis TaxID=1211383 RepID=UPI0038B704A1